MKKRIYPQAERKRHMRWHKRYFQEHDYSTPDTQRKKYTWAEMSLIWNKKLQGGRILTDIEIARWLSRSLQSIQLKRHKMKRERYISKYGRRHEPYIKKESSHIKVFVKASKGSKTK